VAAKELHLLKCILRALRDSVVNGFVFVLSAGRGV